MVGHKFLSSLTKSAVYSAIYNVYIFVIAIFMCKEITKTNVPFVKKDEPFHWQCPQQFLVVGDDSRSTLS